MSSAVGRVQRGVGRLGGYAPPARPGPTAGQNIAGVLLALVLYPIAVNLLDGGPAKAWGWVTAKWINQPYGSTAHAGASPGTSGNNTFGPGGNNSGAPAPGSPITTTAFRTPPMPSTTRSVPQ